VTSKSANRDYYRANGGRAAWASTCGGHSNAHTKSTLGSFTRGSSQVVSSALFCSGSGLARLRFRERTSRGQLWPSSWQNYLEL
jgi:hypothetical protein